MILDFYHIIVVNNFKITFQIFVGDNTNEGKNKKQLATIPLALRSILQIKSTRRYPYACDYGCTCLPASRNESQTGIQRTERTSE